MAIGHFEFLAVCSAWARLLPSGIFNSCPKTMSADVASMYSATAFPQLGLAVSIAQNPASR